MRRVRPDLDVVTIARDVGRTWMSSTLPLVVGSNLCQRKEKLSAKVNALAYSSCSWGKC